jgi:hypothetical protein
LHDLCLVNNQFSDISSLVANTGLGKDDRLNIEENNYGCEDSDVLDDIAELESRDFYEFTHDCMY